MINKLLQDIKSKLNIQGGTFVDAEILDHLNTIDKEDYLDFFKSLSGEEFAYKNGVDRVAIVSKAYKAQKQALLSRNVSSKAHELANKFYSLKVAILNGKEIGEDDREVLNRVKYESTMLNNNVFNKKEINIFNLLGGAKWLHDVDIRPFGETIRAIEAKMKEANTIALIGKIAKLEAPVVEKREIDTSSIYKKV